MQAFTQAQKPRIRFDGKRWRCNLIPKPYSHELLALYNKAWELCHARNRKIQEEAFAREQARRKSRALNPVEKPHIYPTRTRRGKWGCVVMAESQVVRAYATTPVFAFRAMERKKTDIQRLAKYPAKWQGRFRTTACRPRGRSIGQGYTQR